MSSNSIIDEYVELWNDVIAGQQDEYLPHVIESGLATTREKIGVDTLDLVVVKHERLLQLRRELKSVDEEYNSLLAELKAKQLTSNEMLGKDERSTRITDFLFSLVSALNRDFSKQPELEYIVQQIYLFAVKNSD